MTTAFTAMPMKMTMSASRFRGNAMIEFYPVARPRINDPKQGLRNYFVEDTDV